jgi:hypothetical protein
LNAGLKICKIIYFLEKLPGVFFRRRRIRTTPVLSVRDEITFAEYGKPAEKFYRSFGARRVRIVAPRSAYRRGEEKISPRPPAKALEPGKNTPPFRTPRRRKNALTRGTRSLPSGDAGTGVLKITLVL